MFHLPGESLLKAFLKGRFCIDKHGLRVPCQTHFLSVQSSVQCLSAPVKLQAEMGVIFTAVSKFIVAYIALEAAVSI